MDRTVVISSLEKMKVLIDECLVSMGADTSGHVEQSNAHHPHSLSPANIDFSTPVRPFMKAFVALSGSRKFALLLAWIAKGNPENQVALADVESEWDSMAGMLNLKFNRRFTSEAKEADWVESKKTGFYNLRPNWIQAVDKV